MIVDVLESDHALEWRKLNIDLVHVPLDVVLVDHRTDQIGRGAQGLALVDEAPNELLGVGVVMEEQSVVNVTLPVVCLKVNTLRLNSVVEFIHKDLHTCS